MGVSGQLHAAAALSPWKDLWLILYKRSTFLIILDCLWFILQCYAVHVKSVTEH